MTRVREGLLLLLGLALVVRLAAWLLAPAVPLIITLLVLAGIYSLLLRRR
jgi:4-hydroxybenzoate polyprenyltransferase